MFPDFWAPLSAKRLFAAGSGPAANEAEERSLRIIGRLRPGVTEAQAQSGMSVLIPRISQSRQRELQLVDASLESRARYQSWNHADLANVLPVVSAFAMILLIACTNLSNVLLARALNRSREIGVRLSLGASREPYRSATGHGDGRALADCRRGRPCDLPRELGVDTPCDRIFVFDENRNGDFGVQPGLPRFCICVRSCPGHRYCVWARSRSSRHTIDIELRAQGGRCLAWIPVPAIPSARRSGDRPIRFQSCVAHRGGPAPAQYDQIWIGTARLRRGALD